MKAHGKTYCEHRRRIVKIWPINGRSGGKPIRIRFLCTNLATKPHREQAFSEAEGKTWETNWTMDFTKGL
jgi:hypothetical protein